MIVEEKARKKNNMFDNITNFELDFSIYEKSEFSFDHRISKSQKRSIVFLIFNTFRSFVAIGVLTLPFGVKLVGPIIAFFMLIVIALLVAITTHFLLEIADDSKFKGSNYEILGKLLWGKAGQNIIITLLFATSIVTFMGGVLFSVDFLLFAFCSHNIDSMCHSKNIMLTIIMLISFLIATIESLAPFGYVSVFSTFFILIAFVSITVYNLIYVIQTDTDLTERLTYTNFRGIFQFFGLAFYTAEGIGLTIPLRSSFKDNEGFVKIFYGTFTFIIWVYIVLAILSYIVS